MIICQMVFAQCEVSAHESTYCKSLTVTVKSVVVAVCIRLFEPRVHCLLYSKFYRNIQPHFVSSVSILSSNFEVVLPRFPHNLPTSLCFAVHVHIILCYQHFYCSSQLQQGDKSTDVNTTFIPVVLDLI